MGENRQEIFPGADAFTRMWTEFASQMMASGMGFSPQSTPPEAARQARSTMFRAWNEYCDQFMRSGEFLEAMKTSLDGAMQARRQLNEFLGQMQHEFQGASRQDVDQLMASLEHLERRIVDESERISSRLDELAERVEKLERASSPPEQKE